MRRRRKPRVVWLPPAASDRLGANPAIAGFQQGAFDFFLDILGPGSVTGNTATGYVAINSDLPSAEFQASNVAAVSLSDIENSGYRLRRVVGKIFVSMFQSLAVSEDIPQVLVTAGLIVLRVDGSGTPLSAADPRAYDPSSITNWGDPWIWRRSWMLSNFTEADPLGLPLFPDTNTNFPSALDGPHVDAKTARRIGPEERLFLIASATVAKAGGGGNAHISITGELRCLGTMVTSAGNRRNASR